MTMNFNTKVWNKFLDIYTLVTSVLKKSQTHFHGSFFELENIIQKLNFIVHRKNLQKFDILFFCVKLIILILYYIII